MGEVPKGSNEWVYGIIDWEGWPGALEHIAAEEIDDDRLSELWDEAREVYLALEQVKRSIDQVLEEFE
jgi:hypothetical protein